MTTPRRTDIRRPAPEPLRTHDLPVVLIGTALWAVGLVAMFVRSDALAVADWAQWFWVCAAGIFLGAMGVRHVRRHERTLHAESSSSRDATVPPASPEGPR